MKTLSQFLKEHSVKTGQLIPAIHVNGQTHLPEKRTDIHWDILNRLPKRDQNAINKSDDAMAHFGFYHTKRGERKFIPQNKTKTPHTNGKAGRRELDSRDLPYSRDQSMSQRHARGSNKSRDVEVTEAKKLLHKYLTR